MSTRRHLSNQKQYNEEETDQYHECHLLRKGVILMILVYVFFVVLLLVGICLQEVADGLETEDEADKAAAAEEEEMKQLKLNESKGATGNAVMGEGEGESEGVPPSPASSIAGSQSSNG
jgi:flagellar biosynthesis/type III secretory pathway M-ring protein FliF/YscJ